MKVLRSLGLRTDVRAFIAWASARRRGDGGGPFLLAHVADDLGKRLCGVVPPQPLAYPPAADDQVVKVRLAPQEPVVLVEVLLVDGVYPARRPNPDIVAQCHPRIALLLWVGV